MAAVSRRQMIAGATAGLALAPMAEAKPTLTAADIVERIKAHVGVPWMAKTVDGIVAGDPKTPVTGIATVMMATLASLKTAVAAGQNLIITHEPTFWSHQENTAEVQNETLYRDKLAFIQAHNLVCFHFHDHWHALKPRDGIAEGMARHLGWSSAISVDDPHNFTLPPTTLEGLARFLKTRLNAKTMRVIGDPALAVSKVQASWGYAMKQNGIALLNKDIEVLIVGETWEWELQEYVADLVAAGRKKALIVVGHINSEQWGMAYCAEWLQAFVPELPIHFIEMPEPYWAPQG
jgi:putative NIF3 family GTP cyclohydrolase 1 type 2